MKDKIAIIGLGYVGLPLAAIFAKKYLVVGYDINVNRIIELKSGFDSTMEVGRHKLLSVLCNGVNETSGLYCTNDSSDIANCKYYIVTVPTPVDKNNMPLLKPLLSASEIVGGVLSKGNIVIYESTVYPGATEESCVPILESISGLKFNSDFFVGYSPERINPCDKEHTVEKILKVTSGSTTATANAVDKLYKSVITAGTFQASSIKVAEASKVIENAQRDINIAFVNELAKIFNLMEIDTNEVLKASQTKWNFLPFKPGLVGGHCIGVDPYYLAHKAQELGYHPEIILAGRRLNDGMGEYVSSQVIKEMIKKGINMKGSKVLILGITFKENCPDVRNTRVIDIVYSLSELGLNVSIYDPWANQKVVTDEFGFSIYTQPPKDSYDAIILAVGHQEFLSLDIKSMSNKNSVIYDVKGVLNMSIVDKFL